MGLFNLEKLFGMTIRESATDGSDFTNPDADYRRLFLGEDGQLHVKDSAGAVTDIGGGTGNVAADVIWDAAGDLAVGSGANTAARLAIGATDGMAVRRASGAVAWNFPPGHEFDYVQVTTADTAISATAEGSATTLVTGSAVTYDGSTVVMIEFFCYGVAASPNAGTNTAVWVVLYEDGSSIGLMGYTISNTGAGGDGHATPQHLFRRLTPTNASHTYSIRAYASSVATANSHAYAGAAGSGNAVPMFIRITKV